jgi:hypothetical protein
VPRASFHPRAAVSSGACHGTHHHHHCSVVREHPITWRAQGAPRAVMRSLFASAHPSRTNDLDSRSLVRKTQIVCRLQMQDPKRRRATWSPRRPVQRSTLVTSIARGTSRGGSYRRYLRETSRFRRSGAHSPAGRQGRTGTTWPKAAADGRLASFAGYVVCGSRLCLRWFKRITARFGSVKRFSRREKRKIASLR